MALEGMMHIPRALQAWIKERDGSNGITIAPWNSRSAVSDTFRPAT